MPPSRLPAAVVLLGLTSLFGDVASEMVFPLLPVFLAGTLGAAPVYLGLVEGVADTVSSLLKLVSGAWSDRLGRRKPLVVAGYGLAGLVRPLFALATAPWHVLAIRVTDRVGKGLRSAPRDALIADAAGADNAGRAFAFHRAADHAGAVLGPLVASLLLAAGLTERGVFAVAAVPGLLALVMTVAVRESAPPPPAEPPPPVAPAQAAPAQAAPAQAAPPAPLTPRFYQLMAILLCFGLANSSDAFLLLRAGEIGVAPEWTPLLWSVFHVAKVLWTALGGGLADRWPKTRLLFAGWAIYAAVYLAFSVATAAWQAWALLMLYAAWSGLCEPAEKALVRELVPPEARGRAFGWYNLVMGVAALPAGLLVGALWSTWGAAAALGLGATVAAMAAAALLWWSTADPPRAGAAA